MLGCVLELCIVGVLVDFFICKCYFFDCNFIGDG